MEVQAYLGLGQAAARGSSPWRMGDELGADEDDGAFMEASPIDNTPADDDEGNMYTSGQQPPAGPYCGPTCASLRACLCADQSVAQVRQ